MDNKTRGLVSSAVSESRFGFRVRKAIATGATVALLLPFVLAGPSPHEGDVCDICGGTAGYTPTPNYPDIVYVLDTIQVAFGKCLEDEFNCCEPSITGCGQNFNGHWERGQPPFTITSNPFTVSVGAACGSSNTNTYSDIAGTVTATVTCNACTESCN